MAAGGLYLAGKEGIFVALALALLIGLSIVIVAELDGWLPAIFCLSLLAGLNLSVRSIGLTVYAFDPLLVTLYVAWLWRAYHGSAKPVRVTAVDWVGLALMIWLLLASLLGRHVPTALNGWLLYLRGFLIYFYFAHALHVRWQVRTVVAALLAMLAVQGGLGLLQFVTRSSIGSISDLVGSTVSTVREVSAGGGNLFRVRGTLNTDTSLAHWLELLVPLGLSLWLAARTRTRRVLLGACVLAGTATQVVTFTRGGWFGLAASVLVVLWLQFRGRLVARRQLTTALLAALLLLALLLPFGGLIRARLFESDENTLTVRENLNRTALSVMADYPLTGIGLDNFVRVAPEYGIGWSWKMEGEMHKVHNMYLALASEAGTLGLVLLLTFVSIIVAQVWKNLQNGGPPGSTGWGMALHRGLLAGLVGMAVHGLVAWGLLSYAVFPLFWLSLGLLAGSSRRREPAGPV